MHVNQHQLRTKLMQELHRADTKGHEPRWIWIENTSGQIWTGPALKKSPALFYQRNNNLRPLAQLRRPDFNRIRRPLIWTRVAKLLTQEAERTAPPTELPTLCAILQRRGKVRHG